MTIFGNSRLGRIGYAIVLLLMLGFDFGKGPIERWIIQKHDDAAHALMAPRAAKESAPSELGVINGKQMPFMLKGHEDAIREIVNSRGKLTRQQIEEKLNAAAQMPLSFTPNRIIDPEVQRLAAERSYYDALFPVAVIVMTGLTIVALLWAVSGRLRDIGWPQFALWILLAPIFLPKFEGIPLPELAAQGLSLLFYGALVVLALVPGEDDEIDQSDTPAGPDLAPTPVPARRPSGQFGKLGVR